MIISTFHLFKFQKNLAFAEPVQNEGRTNFRPGHNVIILGGIQQFQMDWRDLSTSESEESSGWGTLISLRYTFHINILRKFGFVVGTGVQLMPDNKTNKGFYQGTGFVFPSMHFAFVQNFLEESRFIVGAEYSAGWYPNMRQNLNGQGRLNLANIPNVVGVMAILDRFYTRHRAFTVALGWQNVWDSCSNSCKLYAKDSQFSWQKQGFYLQLGTTWQIGDELGG